MNNTRIQQLPIRSRTFTMAILANLIWVNVSEVARYFLLVMPMMRSSLPFIDDVAPMNLPVFAIWGLWDTILVFTLTFFVWIHLDRFGNTIANSLIGGFFIWLAVFVIFWIGAVNMNIAPVKLIPAALPLALLEMLVGAWIVFIIRHREIQNSIY